MVALPLAVYPLAAVVDSADVAHLFCQSKVARRAIPWMVSLRADEEQPIRLRWSHRVPTGADAVSGPPLDRQFSRRQQHSLMAVLALRAVLVAQARFLNSCQLPPFAFQQMHWTPKYRSGASLSIVLAQPPLPQVLKNPSPAERQQHRQETDPLDCESEGRKTLASCSNRESQRDALAFA